MESVAKFNSENNTFFIYPRSRIPNGLHLSYDSCPEVYNNVTPKVVKYCCFIIIYEVTQQSYYKIIQDFLRDYSSTMLIGPAFLLNILSLIVLQKLSKTRTKTSTTNYMMYLCKLDTLTIVSKFFHEIVVVRNASRDSPIVITNFMCKFIAFFESACSITSIYLLIAMSIDKLICVLLPLKVSQLLTPAKAKLVFACIFFVSSLFSSYELFAQQAIELKVSEKKGPPQNKTNSDYEKNYSFIGYDCDSKWPERYKDWLLINNIIKVFVPIIILCVCNSWIVISLSKSKKKTDALFLTREPSTQQKKYSGLLKNSPKKNEHLRLQNSRNDQQFYSCESNLNTKADSTLNISNEPRKRKKQWLNTTRHISIMLFAVSFGFVIFNLPYALKTIFHRQFSKKNKIQTYLYHTNNLFRMSYTKTEVLNSVYYEFASNLTHFLLDLNYIANFFLYFLSGERFRTQLFIMLRCKKKRNTRNNDGHKYSNQKRNELTIKNTNSINDPSISKNKTLVGQL